MSDELKLCPFCGTHGEMIVTIHKVGCPNLNCLMDVWMPVKEWNSRPIEDVLKAEYASLKDDWKQYRDACVEYEDEIKEMKAENERLRYSLSIYAAEGNWLSCDHKGRDWEFDYDDGSNKPWEIARAALDPKP